MTNTIIPQGYEKIDGKLYATLKAQQDAYDDIRLAGVPGQPGAFLYGKPRVPKMPMLAWPLDKIFITQPFGVNPGAYAKYGMKGHDGIDLRTRFWDSPLAHRYAMAAADGWCEPRWDKTGYGYHVRIHHPDGSLTIYGHLSKILVASKQIVKTGETIGITGNTGDSSGPHLHFEYRPPNCDTANGFAGAINPLPLLPPIV